MRAGIFGFADCPGKVAITAPTLRDQKLNVIKRFLHEASEIVHAGDRIVKGNCWWMKCWTICNWHRKAPAGAALLYKRPEPAGG